MMQLNNPHHLGKQVKRTKQNRQNPKQKKNLCFDTKSNIIEQIERIYFLYVLFISQGGYLY